MRPILFLLVFGVTGLAVLVSLGNWQVRRLHWKEGILAEIEARIAADPVPLPTDPDPERDKFLAVTVTGRMEPGEVRVLVSTRDSGAGYRIIAPFVMQDGRRILIDRGYVPAMDKNTPRALGPMTVIGNLHWPDEIDGFTPEPDREANIWFARDVPALAAELGTEPVLVIARSKNDPRVTPLPVDTAGIPNDHLQYAVTWYGLALVWAAMTGYFLWRSRARKQS
ncbi:SURF1 family protein [Jhaorihella thermophila]|uniref:SURF1-like protein n=1 Tax=Jhaorihella thermophila TaxID=488547 RepID=A0A1H5YPX7_9RHOB|nr:SURF1 family protein [Jhaorihella thermophila]SEG25840.1 surfeit locus 1 family protein [Jhaorihella thermophila]